MPTPTFKITPENAKADAANMWEALKEAVSRGSVIVTFSREKRTKDQNRKLWPMLTDISNQVVWHGIKLKPEDWKDVLTACHKQQMMVQGINGGFVALGHRTSNYNKKEFAELIEVIYWFGADQEVKWSEPSLLAYEQYNEAALANG